jgi:hypothetical protein
MNRTGTTLAFWNRMTNFVHGGFKMLFAKSVTKGAQQKRPQAEIIDIESRVGLSKNPSNRNAILKKAQEDRKRIYAFASLASILVLVTVANLTMWSRSDLKPVASSGRGIASVDPDQIKTQSLEEARSIYRKMEQEGRSPASVGEKPSLVDQLRFGVLEGKYSLRMKDGKLLEVEFVDTEQSSDRPKYISQPETFLKEYEALLPVGFDKIEKTTETRSPSDVHQSFNLNKNNQTQATAEFHHDEFGRMISMKIIPKGQDAGESRTDATKDAAP